MPQAVAAFLMFEGAAEEAMNFYVSLFPGSGIKEVIRYGPGPEGREGSFQRAEFTLAGYRLLCFNSPVKHEFKFTPSISLFVDFSDEQEFEDTIQQLSTGGQFLMTPDNYGFSRRFAWLNDRWGVSWQLNLP